jgi:hypothetical protein
MAQFIVDAQSFEAKHRLIRKYLMEECEQVLDQMRDVWMLEADHVTHVRQRLQSTPPKLMAIHLKSTEYISLLSITVDSVQLQVLLLYQLIAWSQVPPTEWRTLLTAYVERLCIWVSVDQLPTSTTTESTGVFKHPGYDGMNSFIRGIQSRFQGTVSTTLLDPLCALVTEADPYTNDTVASPQVVLENIPTPKKSYSASTLQKKDSAQRSGLYSSRSVDHTRRQVVFSEPVMMLPKKRHDLHRTTSFNMARSSILTTPKRNRSLHETIAESPILDTQWKALTPSTPSRSIPYDQVTPVKSRLVHNTFL